MPICPFCHMETDTPCETVAGFQDCPRALGAEGFSVEPQESADLILPNADEMSADELRSAYRKALDALKPFARLATTWTVQSAAHRGAMLTISNGQRMSGIEATAFVAAANAARGTGDDFVHILHVMNIETNLAGYPLGDHGQTMMNIRTMRVDLERMRMQRNKAAERCKKAELAFTTLLKQVELISSCADDKSSSQNLALSLRDAVEEARGLLTPD